MRRNRFFVVILIIMCLSLISFETGISKHFQNKSNYYGTTLACDLGFYY
jgi:hypothetical protein